MKKKRPMGRPLKSWEVRVKSDVQKVKRGESWQSLAMNREKW